MGYVPLSDAEICKQQGFSVGDVLIGTEVCGSESWTDIIQITAIGTQHLFARWVMKDRNGFFRPDWDREVNTTLTCRAWKKIDRVPVDENRPSPKWFTTADNSN